MTRKIKRTIIATVIIVIITVICSFNSNVANGSNTAEVPMRTLYSLDQRELTIPRSQVETYLNLGWFLEPVTKLYSPTGGFIVVAKTDIEDYKQKGYKEPLPVNESDVVLLAKVIHAEATQHSNFRVLDRQYVGAVVLNRVKHPSFPNDLRSVIYAPSQYACVGTYLFNQHPPQECLDIARQLLEGETFGVPSNVVFQAQFTQGKGVWKRVGVHYYCYI